MAPSNDTDTNDAPAPAQSYAFALVVTREFAPGDTYQKGQRITDDAAIKAFLDRFPDGSAVRVAKA